jgi:hypothetical protein
VGPGDYGGPTQSCPLDLGSPAIDADTVPWTGTFYECRATDQRGLPRPGGAACDIGSTELQIAPPEALMPANSAGACTGAADCTVETWGVDLNGGTGYLWNVDGGATGGPAELFLGVAVPNGNRAMGLLVNGAPVTVISTNATDSPRPAGKEFGPFAVTLNPGNNIVELVDDQGTAELDVHYLRVESSLGLCDNGVCSSKESCSTCLEDCGACGVTEQLLFSQSADGCTGASNCTEERWGVDLNGDTGYQWTVSGGATGGGVSLFTKVAVLSGTRAMGLVVNGNPISVVSTTSSASPRPIGKEFGPFFVTLAPGDNVIELVDNQGTAEFDVHYLRTELSSGGPCTSFCTNPEIISWSGSYQGVGLGAGARCLETTQPVTGGNCGNFAYDRSLFLNGTEMPCNTGNWTSLPSAVNGGYCVRITPGDQTYAYVTLW